MCPNDTQPRRWQLLYDNEEESDVKFLVGPEMLLIPGHRSVLAKSNPVFKAMLEGEFPVPHPPQSIQITDVDGRAFENLLRFLYGREVTLQSVTTAVLTLCAAYKYLCAELVNLCIAYLDDNIQVSTVLEIFMYIRQYTHQCHTPSAPPLTDDPAHAPTPQVMPSCDKLLHNTLNFIDHHADEVLEQEYIEDLDVEGLEVILSRDTLAVSSENLVFTALKRWCNRECKRRHLDLTDENRRKVLGEDALYLVRYLLMSQDDFLYGPMESGWLEQRDLTAMLCHILNKPSDVPKKLETKWPQLKQPRVLTDVGNFPLSKRTRVQVSCKGEDSTKEKGKKHKCGHKKDKKRKNSSTPSPSPEREKRTTGAKLAECFCGAIACIFD